MPADGEKMPVCSSRGANYGATTARRCGAIEPGMHDEFREHRACSAEVLPRSRPGEHGLAVPQPILLRASALMR